MKHFKAVYNLVKNSFFSLLRAERSPPWTSSIQILPWIEYKMFWPFLYKNLHNFYSIFVGLKGSKKDENMMSCTRLYVESTETQLDKGRKRRILSLPKE